MAGLTNRNGPVTKTAIAPSSIIATVFGGVTDSIADIAHRYGVSAHSVSGANEHVLTAPGSGSGTVAIPALPIAPYVAMMGPVPPGPQPVWGTGWLGAVSMVQGQYAGQPLSTAPYGPEIHGG